MLRLVEDEAAKVEPDLTEAEGAQIIEGTLLSVAARMPVESELRALALRSQERWAVIARSAAVRQEVGA